MYSYPKLEGVPLLDLAETQKLVEEIDPERYSWENPVLSRKDVHDLFNEVFKDRVFTGEYRVSASTQVQQFNSKLRDLSKLKAIQNYRNTRYSESNLRKAYFTSNELTLAIVANQIADFSMEAAFQQFMDKLGKKTEWEVLVDSTNQITII